MKESALERSLDKRVRTAGGLTFKFCSPENPGVPDRIVIAPDGRIIFVELKTKIGVVSKIQAWQMNRLRDCGCDVRVLKGFDQVRDFVKEVFA